MPSPGTLGHTVASLFRYGKKVSLRSTRRYASLASARPLRGHTPASLPFSRSQAVSW